MVINLKIIDTRALLKALGYTFVSEVREKIEPARVNVKFEDLFKEFSENDLWISRKELFEHQYKAFIELINGKNIILRSGTGSGKTEAWILYFLKRAREGKFRALAIYPTLALANDQIRRITIYCNALKISVLQLDAPTRDKLKKKIGLRGIREKINLSNLIITNPAYLLIELKKYFLRQHDSLLEPFLSNLDLIVIDELDFYGPRSLALLMAMLELLSLINKEQQIVLLTATLANPDELGSYLKRLTGRDYVVIDGKPFHVENHTIIVLGKNLENIWRIIRGLREELVKKKDIDRDIIRALDDYKLFQENAYRVLAYLEALGYSVPSISMDYTEIIGKYLDDNGVTIVFTKSIAKAEEVAKRLKTKYSSYKESIASHHHLVPKHLREEIEEGARTGRVKIIVSPRTLTQGIDIGTVIRVVHIGLPEDVREYLQREGRKGRREEIPFTESIIIPSSRWDWELLSKGIEALKKWLSLPLEKTVINPNNLYIKLFTGIVKLLSPWLRLDPDGHEREALRKAGIFKNGNIDRRRLKKIWDRMGFYEFAPPYGIKRYLEIEEGLRPLEPIGHCDLVEKFQIGCIDYSSDALVTSHRVVRKGRIVTAVYEKPIWSVRFWEDEALAEAYEEYLDIKHRWMEEPSLIKDLMRGKIFTDVYCVVYPPRKGFGQYIKVPNRVVWIVSSERPRIFRVGSKHIVSHDRKLIYVPTPVHGEYRDYTYGYLYEVDERLDPGLLRLGLAYIMIVLRRLYGIPFETILYGVETVGDKKFFEIHEPESAGIIDLLDWLDVRKSIEKYEPDELDTILLNQIDDLAYSYFLSNNLDWDPVKEYALMIVDYILSREKIVLEIMGRLKAIPRPSPGLKIVSLDSFVEIIDRGDVFTLPMKLIALAYYDGENIISYVDMIPHLPGTRPSDELRDFENKIEDLIYYGEYKLIVPTKDLADTLEKIGLRKLPRLIKSRSIEIIPLLSSKGYHSISMNDIEELMKLIVPDTEIVYIDTIHRIISRIRDKGYTKLLDKEKNLIQNYIKTRTIMNYILYLVTNQ